MLSTIKKYAIGAGVMLVISAATSCKKNFAEVNTNPTIVTKPDLKFLLTYSEDRTEFYQYNEWIWESMEHLFRYTQHITSDPYEITSNVNGRYGAFYLQVAPNLFEIRRQIDQMPDKDNYQKMRALTYVLQILHAIKVTDMNGSIPYTEAIQGRYEANFSPAYDSQETLFTTWLSELDAAIAILGNGSLANQNTYGNADVFYQSDWTKWTKLANTLKLRIAARLENADNAKTQAIFKQVMQDPIGPITTDDAQMTYQNVDYLPFGGGGEINYRSARYGTASIVGFMKKAEDPRLPIYFEKNGLVGDFRDTLTKYGATLPAFINPSDPLIEYQGGPADWTISPTIAAYIKNPFVVGNTNPGNGQSRYFLISPINRKFFSPRNNGITDGMFRDLIVSNAESCLLIAEFIQKGYSGSVDTKGSAEDWYKKGVASSIKTMNAVAVVANSTTGFTGNGDAEVAAYLSGADVAFNGTNDLERIYIQQYLNFYRNPNEAFVFSRRTGYPKNTSTYYAREPFNETIPRRWWLSDPGQVNRENWNAAMSAQNFTPNAQDVPTLNSQRIWYDKTAPEFGQGQ